MAASCGSLALERRRFQSYKNDNWQLVRLASIFVATARLLRIQYGNALYHVMAREGVRRGAVRQEKITRARWREVTTSFLIAPADALRTFEIGAGADFAC